MKMSPTSRPVAMRPVGVGDDELHGDGADHDHDRRQREQHRVGERGPEVLLAHHLEGVGDALQHAVRAGAVGAVAVLHEGQDAALEDDVDERRHEHDRVGDDDEEDGAEDAEDDVHQRSMPPSTRSMLPEMATASAILLPRSSLGKSCRLQKHGSRNLSRYGYRDPSLTM